MRSLSISLVLYKNKIEEISETIEMLFDSALSIKLYLVDNSPTNTLGKHFSKDLRIEYLKITAQPFPNLHTLGARYSKNTRPIIACDEIRLE